MGAAGTPATTDNNNNENNADSHRATSKERVSAVTVAVKSTGRKLNSGRITAASDAVGVAGAVSIVMIL